MNDENLIPLNLRPIDEAREIQRHGGKASGEARRRIKQKRKLLSIYLDILDKSPKVIDSKRRRTKSEPRKKRRKTNDE